jgi:hypothetical protein
VLRQELRGTRFRRSVRPSFNPISPGEQAASARYEKELVMTRGLLQNNKTEEVDLVSMMAVAVETVDPTEPTAHP